MTFHDLRIVQQLTPRARKLHCRKCNRYFAMNDEFQAFIEWDNDLEFLYAEVLGCGRTNL